MGLNNIQLKPSMVADLYKNSLIETGGSVMPEANGIKYLGSNQKNILVIVSHQSVRFLPDTELSFLTTVLTACNLSIADIGIINLFQNQINDIQNFVNAEAKNILLFGVEPLSIGLPIHFPAFQLQAFNNRTYLHAPALLQIEQEKALKTRLWTSLKAMFRI